MEKAVPRANASLIRKKDLLDYVNKTLGLDIKTLGSLHKCVIYCDACFIFKNGGDLMPVMAYLLRISNAIIGEREF